jgi:predicted transposase YdaD
MMNNAISRFDSAYKSLFSNPRIFYQLIRYFVDEDFVKGLKPENIKRLEKSSFVSSEFLQREADLIYQVDLDGKDLYFYILLEFQSTPDKRIPIRLFSYLFLY